MRKKIEKKCRKIKKKRKRQKSSKKKGRFIIRTGKIITRWLNARRPDKHLPRKILFVRFVGNYRMKSCPKVPKIKRPQLG